MYYLGLDIGRSSIKVALVEASGGKSVLVVHEPKEEMSMTALKSDWAEQTDIEKTIADIVIKILSICKNICYPLFN